MPLVTSQPEPIIQINVTHFSTFESGGAGRAAYRIHRSLVDHAALTGTCSRLRVIYGCSQDSTVLAGSAQGANPIWRRLRPRLAARYPRRFDDGNSVLHSTCWPASGVGRELAGSGAQLIHLHWIGRAGLSIEEVGRFPQPLVWTLHDQWAFLGAEHYVRLPPAVDRRFVEGYLRANRPPHERGPDLNRLTWERKRRAWRRPISIVCPSRWLAAEAQSSALMHDWPVHVIPYPIDIDRWSPVDKRLARQEFNLPQNASLILFGALSGTSDPRKGTHLLHKSLFQLADRLPPHSQRPQLVVFGSSSPIDKSIYPFPVHDLGMIHDDYCLAKIYSSADVMVVPSLQEAFGQTASEASACGTPVVAFKEGGLVDVVAHLNTGVLAFPFDPASLAESILWVLENPHRSTQLGIAARSRACKEWAPARIAARYAELYRDLLASPPAR